MFLRFESSDSNILDTTVHRIVGELLEAEIDMQGPFPLPTRREHYTVLTSNVRRKHSIDTHKRMIILVNVHPSTFAKASSSELPTGVSFGLRVTNATIMQVRHR